MAINLYYYYYYYYYYYFKKLLGEIREVQHLGYWDGSNKEPLSTVTKKLHGSLVEFQAKNPDRRNCNVGTTSWLWTNGLQYLLHLLVTLN